MPNTADELLKLPPDEQEAWFNAHQEAKFQAALLECPVVAMSIESGVMTPISDEFFTNFPEPFIQH